MQQRLAPPERDGEQPGVDAQQEPEHQRRMFAVGPRRRQEDREQQRERCVQTCDLLEPRPPPAVRGRVERTSSAGQPERHESQDREREEDCRGDRQLGRREERRDPSPLVEGREHQAQSREQRPALSVGDPAEAGVEQQQVAEQPERVVLSGREQRRSREAADQTQQGDEHRVAPDGEQDGDHGDQGHERERRHRPDEFPQAVGGEEGREEDDDGRAVERIGRDRVAACGLQLAADEQADANRQADGHADRRLQPAPLNRVAQEVDGGQREQDPGGPREEPNADEFLPVERRLLPGFRRDGLGCRANWFGFPRWADRLRRGLPDANGGRRSRRPGSGGASTSDGRPVGGFARCTTTGGVTTGGATAEGATTGVAATGGVDKRSASGGAGLTRGALASSSIRSRTCETVSDASDCRASSSDTLRVSRATQMSRPKRTSRTSAIVSALPETA